jgi:peroxiredoxin
MPDKKLLIRSFLLTICIFWSLSCSSTTGAAESEEAKTISTGMNLPQFMLDAPGSASDQKYLGLTELKPFCFSQIAAKIIILELFGIYCPHCRKQAPELNKVYNFIKNDPQLSNGIKMVGIGAGAHKKQVDSWKTTLHVPFPLFPDPETAIWQKFGKPGVPCTLIVSDTGKVLATHLGHTEDIEEFFRQIKKFYFDQK